MPPAATEPWASAPPDGLVDLRAVLPDACFDIRYATADNFTGVPLPGYEVPGAWLRPETAAALAEVQATLVPSGRALRVFDAYRPARASRAMAAWARSHGRADLLRDGYVAARSTHAAGRTVDVGLCELATGAAVDMGTQFDTFSEASHHGAATGAAGAARRQLRAAMVAAGFSAYRREWWHYSHRGPADGDAVPEDAAYFDPTAP